MCRSGHEGHATNARRCPLSETHRQAHNATRMMTRVAAALQTDTISDARRAYLREAFMRHCDRLRDLRGMSTGQYPAVPLSVSDVSRYTPDGLDRMPFEQLDQTSADAAERGDWAACEVLCLELERREHLAALHPHQVEDDERRRRANLDRDQRISRLDPVLHPAARHAMTRRQILKAERAEYETHIELEILAAEEATRGNLLNPAGKNATARGRGPSARALWTNHIVAQAYASEELRRWWQEHPRMSFAAWQEMAAGRFGEARETVAKSSLISI